MSTHSMIGILNTNGTNTSIYCHWDGYPSHHAPILLTHYNTPEQIRALLAFGDISMLAEETGEQHDFDDRSHRDWCTFYFRDRKQPGCEAVTYANDRSLCAAAYNCDARWLYLFEPLPGERLTQAKWRIYKLPAELHHTHDWADLTLTTKD